MANSFAVNVRKIRFVYFLGFKKMNLILRTVSGLRKAEHKVVSVFPTMPASLTHMPHTVIMSQTGDRIVYVLFPLSLPHDVQWSCLLGLLWTMAVSRSVLLMSLMA